MGLLALGYLSTVCISTSMLTLLCISDNIDIQSSLYRCNGRFSLRIHGGAAFDSRPRTAGVMLPLTRFGHPVHLKCWSPLLEGTYGIRTTMVACLALATSSRTALRAQGKSWLLKWPDASLCIPVIAFWLTTTSITPGFAACNA